MTKTAEKPWEAEGLSKSTYYRNLRKGKSATPVKPVSKIFKPFPRGKKVEPPKVDYTPTFNTELERSVPATNGHGTHAMAIAFCELMGITDQSGTFVKVPTQIALGVYSYLTEKVRG